MIKRIFDLLFGFIAFVFLLPIMIVVAILVMFYHGWPVLFTQQRPGYRGEIFLFYKFRSMNERRDATGNLLPDADRLTSFGRFIRKTSLDELPSLVNVLKGEMSLVGPRPLLVKYLPLYSEFQKKRHDVKPGITGWAQINGRNSINWDQKFEMDVWYVNNRSMLLDIRILFLTVFKVFNRQGISHEGSDTMPEFKG
jgi:sugar transferase EpsL